MKNPKFKKYLVFGSLITTTLVIAPLVTLSCKSNNKQNKNAKESWTIMVYMCGSDLESANTPGLGTLDLIEMMKANIPSNFQILVETGGADHWNTHTPVPSIKNNKLQRWQIKKNEMKILSEVDAACMSDESTLTNFLDWGLTHAREVSSQHVASILWDHGGGWAGVCNDNSSANTQGKIYLTLNELNGAFNDALSNQQKYEKFDIIGFDACLMSELEVYSSIHDYTKYIVASEELEPGNGWEYASLINKTVNASDNPQKVASEWVESFKSFYSPYSIEATLSAFDTNRWDSLISAFSAWIAASGFTAANFKTDSGDNSITQQLGRDAQGANWTTVDFGMIVKNCRDTNTQKANDVTDILNQSIINKWSSQGISSSATGLSIGVPNNSNLLCKPENYKPCVYNEQWQWTSYLSQYLSKLNV